MRRILALPLVAALVLTLWTPSVDADDHGLADARRRATQAAQELSTAESQLGRLEAEINDLVARTEAAEARLDDLRGVVRDTVVQQFINAEASQVPVPDADLNRQARADALTRFVTQGNQDAIDEFLAVTEDLEVSAAALAERREAQTDAVTELRDRRAALDAELRRLEELERQRQAEERRRQDEERRRRAAEEARRREAAAEARRQAAATTTPTTAAGPAATPAPTSAPTTTRAPATSTTQAPARSEPSGPIASGEWVCPVQGPHAFVDSWGAPRSGGRRHQGVDMMAARGVPTVAPVSGRVEHRGNSLGGLSWHLHGDDGTYYFGTHLSAYANQGAGWVEAGTLIGYVGDTGNAAGNPHLHFEIHPGGRGNPINPYPTVSRHC